MNWIQMPNSNALQKSVCACIGAKCKGRNGCKEFFCGIQFGTCASLVCVAHFQG
jgi:hypothetical protein